MNWEVIAALAQVIAAVLVIPSLGPTFKTNANPAIGYAKFFSRSHDAVIRVYDGADNMIETHQHKGDFKEW